MKATPRLPQLDFSGDHRHSATMQWRLLVVLFVALGTPAVPSAQVEPPAVPAAQADNEEDARRAFYNAQYKTAATLTLEPCLSGADGLSACELRTAALLFQIKRAIGDAPDRDAAWKRCASCPELAAAFDVALKRGQALARATLKSRPDDDETLFLLGKLDLNFVWLYLGTLGRRTGWGEYWEARKSLDKVLVRHPEHVRARVARGWIDYIVDTKMPRGTRWLLGGGSKKKGLLAVRQAAETDADFFTRAEARFALWDMQVRERDLSAAVATARILARDFHENQELKDFIKAHDSAQ